MTVQVVLYLVGYFLISAALPVALGAAASTSLRWSVASSSTDVTEFLRAERDDGTNMDVPRTPLYRVAATLR
jgi:hypothetical protein